MSVAEAMAAGLPVIASDLGGTPEIVGDRAARLVAPGNVAAWTTALRDLADAALVDEAGTAGRQRWEQRFSPSANLPMLEAAYRRAAISSGRPPDGPPQYGDCPRSQTDDE
jgi:glycosyltransferase involved in cell wall biosynthesis